MKVSEIEKAFTIFFSLENGLSTDRESGKRHLADVQQMFADQEAAKARLKKENPLIYEFYDLGMPDTPGDLAFGTSITYPGKIGNEYFMTKGHFHSILETAEVYFCFQGQGMMMMENPEGEWDIQCLTP